MCLSKAGWSFFLSEDDAFDLLDARTLALALGFVMNSFITFTPSTLAIVDDFRIAQAFARVREMIDETMPLAGVPSIYLWTLERGPKHGLHIHMLVHVPRGLEHHFSSWLERCFMIAFERRLFRSEASSSLKIEWPKGDEVSWQDDNIRYLLKACDREATRADPLAPLNAPRRVPLSAILGIDHKINRTRESEGLVYGERRGWSGAIDPHWLRLCDANHLISLDRSKALMPDAIWSWDVIKARADGRLDEFLRNVAAVQAAAGLPAFDNRAGRLRRRRFNGRRRYFGRKLDQAAPP